MYIVSRYRLSAIKLFTLILIGLSINAKGELSEDDKTAIKTVFEYSDANTINEIFEHTNNDEPLLNLITVIIQHWRDGELDDDVLRTLIYTSLLSIYKAIHMIKSFGLSISEENSDSSYQIDDDASASCLCNDVSL